MNWKTMIGANVRVYKLNGEVCFDGVLENVSQDGNLEINDGECDITVNPNKNKVEVI